MQGDRYNNKWVWGHNFLCYMRRVTKGGTTDYTRVILNKAHNHTNIFWKEISIFFKKNVLSNHYKTCLILKDAKKPNHRKIQLKSKPKFLSFILRWSSLSWGNFDLIFNDFSSQFIRKTLNACTLRNWTIKWVENASNNAINLERQT